MAQLNDLIVNGNTRFLNSAYGNLVGSASSAINAGTATSSVSSNWNNLINKPISFTPASHNHNYELSAETTALNVSGGISISAGNSNVTITTADKTILISTKNVTSAETALTAQHYTPTVSNHELVFG